MTQDRPRALVLEDDADAAEFTRIALERFGGMDVAVVGTAGDALRLLREQHFDILVSDIELPGRSGLEILPEVRMIDPTLPVMVITAHGSVSHAVEALRKSADEFLVKPVTAMQIVERATELVRSGRERDAAGREAVLAIGAHPDDVEIGVGATLAAHAAAGDRLTILTLSPGAVGGEVTLRHAEALEAAAVVGARLVHLAFPDTRLDPADGLITAIEEVVADVRPDRVYTHTSHDRHQDHRAVHEAVQVAARQVPSLWCYQSPSSTVQFQPNRFVDVDGFVETKLRMLAAYASQAHRDYMDPGLVQATARYWSRFSPALAVEPLETVRASESLAAAAQAVRPALGDVEVEHLRGVDES
ncbi:response regulator receiver protein [Beutenbergia cavernae DSM 12333]|uniref:Response regulator receiver protein n=1 Tax=Beutenbergia cavernae (strain ATCC BAA-8 / DSM 12333 / CCUG 43141 / JCM 11478 / NBRC 16432 / NCIMB 13614 / HKI 0122) TaxID=471853 RepID=C5BWE4_BEUC1|nr:PIG-L family deacetylase [Beutenbergia cavernae]ACQ78602.1 response regulator receiver protein [Beutenbergia cavernae DSM 12333]